MSGKRGYLELENVSRVQGSWGGSPVPQRFLRAPARDTAACTAAANSTGFDIPGHDLSTVQSGISDSRDCARVCCATARCAGGSLRDCSVVQYILLRKCARVC